MSKLNKFHITFADFIQSHLPIHFKGKLRVFCMVLG